MALMMLFKKRPKKSVVPPSGNIKKPVNIPAKKHGAPRAHTIQYNQRLATLISMISYHDSISLFANY
jgi:hypothetical protein